MTRYEQVTDCAIAWSQKRVEYYRRCQRLAFSLVTGYTYFLGCSPDQVVYIPLDKDLKTSGEAAPIRHDLAMVFGNDGFYYFCFRVKYEKNGVPEFAYDLSTLGLKLIDNTATVRVEKRDFVIDLTNMTNCDELFNALFDASMQFFTSPTSSPSERIGFGRN